jgi:hypothetical protein
MVFTQDITEFVPWQGGADTYRDIEDAGKLDDLFDLLDELFYGEPPSDTDVNDFLWFDRDYVYERLGMEVG